MTYRRMSSRALWGGALLLSLVLAVPELARAEAETKAESQGLASRVKQAIGKAEENGKIAAPVEKALEQLLQALDEEKKHRHHHRHDQSEGTFGAGLEQASDPSTASDGSAGNTDPASDSSGASSGSGTNPGATSSPLAGSAGSSSASPPSSAPSKGNKSQNKQSQGQEPHRGVHSAFAAGLRHAEREWHERKEERRERRLERAFARGLIALRSAEEHSDGTVSKPALSPNSQKGSTTSNVTKTASGTPAKGTGQTVGASPQAAKRAWPADDGKHRLASEEARKMAAAAAHGRTGVLVGQQPATANTPVHPTTGSAGHMSAGRRAGMLAGAKHFGHKK